MQQQQKQWSPFLKLNVAEQYHKYKNTVAKHASKDRIFKSKKRVQAHN